MHGIPDVLGMKMPAAAKLLDAAGVSYITEILRPAGAGAYRAGRRYLNAAQAAPQADSQPDMGVLRVIRQTHADDGTVRLSLCAVPEIADTAYSQEQQE